MLLALSEVTGTQSTCQNYHLKFQQVSGLNEAAVNALTKETFFYFKQEMQFSW